LSAQGDLVEHVRLAQDGPILNEELYKWNSEFESKLDWKYNNYFKSEGETERIKGRAMLKDEGHDTEG
jgi:hypothetical protein